MNATTVRPPAASAASAVPPGDLSEPLLSLLDLMDLATRARAAASVAQLRFLLVNDTHELTPYRQAALWLADSGVSALSGVVQAEANAPYTQWLTRVMRHCHTHMPASGAIDVTALPPELAAQWSEWLPANAWFLRLDSVPPGGAARGALLLARDAAWTPRETRLLQEWSDIWVHAWTGLTRAAGWRWPRFAPSPSADAPMEGVAPARRRRWLWGVGALVLVMALPVRLTVLAPGELVPARPEVVRAPLDGVVAQFHVQPNEQVRKGQPLFTFDLALVRNRLDVARQALATAQAEYRQAGHQALTDARSKAQLATLVGRIEEKRAEALYLQDQLTRAQVIAPRDGVALFDDPSAWIGRPVTLGERILRVAALDDIEVEAWLGVADAIPLPADASVSLHLNADPLSPVQARLRYLAHDAVERPDGSYAYRLRASLTGPTTHRIGLKGSVRVSGEWVPLGYWLMRRPWASVRSLLAW
ncbi:MAG: hypothetical protein RI884_1597 [Pseudomonadota bacterium]